MFLFLFYPLSLLIYCLNCYACTFVTCFLEEMIIIIKTGIHYGDNHYSNDNQKTVFKKMKRSNQLRLCIVNDVDILTSGEAFSINQSLGGLTWPK